jgi:iron complex transport system ATP-binding protein
VIEAIVSGFFSSLGVHYQLREQIEDRQVEKSEAVMRTLGLEALRDREFRTLSTGQQRRCLLGRALVHDPDTLILDEPTSGLDMTAGFDYLDRIRELARRGRSLVLVTHHLNEIPPEIDRVILLKNGTIFADGSKDRMLTGKMLSEVYDASIEVIETGGYYLAYPG